MIDCRDLAAMLADGGAMVDYTTVFRLIQACAATLVQRTRAHLQLDLDFGGLRTAKRALASYEVLATARKGWVCKVKGSDMRAQAVFCRTVLGSRLNRPTVTT